MRRKLSVTKLRTGSILLLLIAPTLFILLPTIPNAHAAPPWNSTTSFGSAEGNQCEIVSFQNYIVCMPSQAGTTYYATYDVGKIGTWIATTGPSQTYFGSNTPWDCFSAVAGKAQDSYLYCMGYNAAGTGIQAQYAKFKATGGISSTWNATNSADSNVVNTQMNNNCDAVLGSYVYCALASGGAFHFEWARINQTDGSLESWQTSTQLSSAEASNCRISKYFSTMYCLGSYNSYNAVTYYFAVSALGLGVGTVHTTTVYPFAVKNMSCGIVFPDIYCVGGQNSTGTIQSTVYQAELSDSGIGPWNATTPYPLPVYFHNCVADDHDKVLSCGTGLTTGNAHTGTEYYMNVEPASNFMVTITNMDAGNYLIANGKSYDFHTVVTSNALPGVNQYRITDVRVQWNDSVHTVTMEYSNDTHDNGFLGFKLVNGSGYVSLQGGKAVSTISQGVREIVIDFQVVLKNTIIDSGNRGIQLFAVNAFNMTRGYEYVRTNYFNILNQGGGVTVIKSGFCYQPPGFDTFEAECSYDSSPKSWIAINSSWYQIQQYHAQFSVRLTHPNSSADANACVFCWQDYSHSTPGGEVYMNPGDWKIHYGLYYYDNSTWLKGINVVLQMVEGNQGTNDEWTQLSAAWYDGNTLVRNDTFNNWIQQAPLAQESFWVDLWYSGNNASTSMGGRIGSYHTGMLNSGYLWWSSWSPMLQNNTDSQILVPLKDHTGKAMSAQLAQFSKVYMNMTRLTNSTKGGAYTPGTVWTRLFKVQTFSTTTGPMSSIPTPDFVPAVIPIIQNTGFFSPLLNALGAIGKFFINGLQALGNVIWAQLGNQFPWFTSFWGTVGSLIINFALIVGDLASYLAAFLAFLPSLFGPVASIVSVISQSWGTITAAFNEFSPAQLAELAIVVSLMLLCDYVFTAFEKNDTMALIRLARASWGIMQTMLFWTWALAKFIIDAVEGLIP